MWLIVGLGNPGEEYENTRHNTGRIVAKHFIKQQKFPDFEMSGNAKALYSNGKVGKEKVEVILPETFMNKSGFSVSYASKKHKIKPSNIVVVHDDLDLPLGKMKISFNRGTGGHRGVESIKKNLKTNEFVRIRVGISPSTPSGKTKKPQGEKKVGDFILGKFKKSEMESLKKISKKASQAIETVVVSGKEKAMGEFN